MGGAEGREASLASEKGGQRGRRPSAEAADVRRCCAAVGVVDWVKILPISEDRYPLHISNTSRVLQCDGLDLY